MKTLKIILILLLNCAILYSANLSVKDLEQTCYAKSWDKTNQILLSKGWYYYSSSNDTITNRYINKCITWSYNNDDYSEEANGWFTIYTDGTKNGEVAKINYQFFDVDDYGTLITTLDDNGYHMLEDNVKDNETSTIYENKNFILNIIISKESKIIEEKVWKEGYWKGGYRTSYYGNMEWEDKHEYVSGEYVPQPKTIYFTRYMANLIRKYGKYDEKNGTKISYYNNGQIVQKYTLSNGELTGSFIWYTSEGKVYEKWTHNNGIWNFEDYDYHFPDKLTLKANKKNNSEKAHGLFYRYDSSGRMTEKCEGDLKIFAVTNPQDVLGCIIYFEDKDGTYTQTTYNYKDGSIISTTTTNIISGKGERVTYDNKKHVLEDIQIVNGHKCGHAKEYTYEDDILISSFEGSYKNDSTQTGLCTHVWTDDGKQYKSYSNIKDGKKEGLCKCYLLSNGTEMLVETAYYIDDKLNGVKCEIFADSIRYITYKNGNKDGDSKTYYNANIQNQYASDSSQLTLVASGKYLNNMLNGQWNFYMPSPLNINLFASQQGAVYASKTYFNDKLDGEYYEFDSNHQTLIKGQFKKGKKEGIWSFYGDELSKMKIQKYQIKYRNDRWVSTTITFQDSVITFSSPRGIKYETILYSITRKNIEETKRVFVDNKILDMLMQQVLTEDELYSIYYGEKDGEYTIYDRDKDQILTSGSYSHGKAISVWKTYDIDENIMILWEPSETPTILHFNTINPNSVYSGIYRQSLKNGFIEILPIKKGVANGVSKVIDPHTGKTQYKNKYSNGLKMKSFAH